MGSDKSPSLFPTIQYTTPSLRHNRKNRCYHPCKCRL